MYKRFTGEGNEGCKEPLGCHADIIFVEGEREGRRTWWEKSRTANQF